MVIVMLPLAELVKIGLEIGKLIEDSRIAEARQLVTRLTVQLERRREIDDINRTAIGDLRNRVKVLEAENARLTNEIDLQKKKQGGPV